MTEISDTITNIIKMAISGEEESHGIYVKASGLVKGVAAQSMLKELATEELGHKAKLEGLLRKGVDWRITERAFKRVTDLKLGDHLRARPLSDDADLQDILIFAIKREQESHDLYAGLAGVTSDETVKNLFDFLASEEAGHKRKLEALYEEIVYQHF